MKKGKREQAELRKICPAREALRLPSARRVVVEEKIRAAAAPRFPRSQASSGTSSKSRRATDARK